MSLSLAGLLVVAGVASGDWASAASLGMVGGLAAALFAAGLIVAATWLGSSELRQALRR